MLELERKISQRVKKQMEKTQKEYYLREQMKAIQKELGEKEGRAGEVGGTARAAGGGRTCRRRSRRRVEKEIDRLEKMPATSAEGAVIRNYVDWLLALPWNKTTEDDLDLDKARSDSERGSLRPGEAEGARAGIFGGAEAGQEAERPDPVPRRPARRRQDVARPVPSPGRWAASSCASRSAACATKRKSAATAARTSARCRAASSRA